MSDVDISRERIERLKAMGSADYIHIALLDKIDALAKERDELQAEVERLAEDRARRLGHIDRNGNPPLTKEELAEFREKNPMDHLALAALAAWVNVRPDQLPKEMQAHNCPDTMEAWARVAAAIENSLQRKEENE